MDGNVVIARTISDGVGQVTIPDVPPGHYVIRATRDGFADTTTSPFGVRPGETEQVLVEMRLAFVRESVERRRVLQFADAEHPAGRGQRRAELARRWTSSRSPATTSSR